MKAAKKLPSKPSDLILLALHDLELVERDPKYKVDMSWWYDGSRKKCEVCMAGAVMAKTLGVHSEEFLSVGSDESVTHKLRAIDWFRVGSIERGLSKMSIPMPFCSPLPPLVEITDYHKNKNKFKFDMLCLALMFQLVDL